MVVAPAVPPLSDQSSEVLRTIRDEYGGAEGASGALHQADRAMTKLFQRDFTDRLLLLLSVLVFTAVVLFILKERVLHW